MRYRQLWDGIASRKDWRQYILPNRTDEQFVKEGRLQAKSLQPFLYGVVMDYGCGVGRVLRHVKAEQLVGVDVSARFLQVAAEFDIEPVLSDGIHIPLADKSIDTAYSLMVFQHCDKEDHLEQLQEIVRVTKDRCLVQFPRLGYYEGHDGTNVYESDELLDLAEQLSVNSFSLRTWSLVRYSDGVHEQREWLMDITP